MRRESRKQDQPLYEVVRSGINERLHSGRWAAGDRIPTEGQLAEEFGVGIGTIRRAVEELVAEGLLIRRARVGTTVARLTDTRAFDLFFSFVGGAGQPLKVSARLRSFRREKASKELAQRLGLAPGAPVAKVENIRFIGGTPVMLDRIWIPLSLFKDLTPENFTARRDSIYSYYQEQYGVSVVRVLEDLGACAAERGLAGVLGLEEGAPLLRIERTAYTFKDTPVEFRVRFVDARHARYRNVRGLQD
ncbi:MAG: transcriptional regulator, GntR family [Betaproteobacteria bacterium]|nr:transcriptional regulator, GntR family [Betaproteobacteria bacterium]